MKKNHLISIIALTTVLVYAQEPASLAQDTPLSGNVHGFIRVEQSPYVVTDNLTVEENQVLVIEPGVKLQFAPGTGLYVNDLRMPSDACSKIWIEEVEKLANS